MVKIQIKLSESDFKNLRRLADLEYRDPKQQAVILIHEGLENRGLVNTDAGNTEDAKLCTEGVQNG